MNISTTFSDELQYMSTIFRNTGLLMTRMDQDVCVLLGAGGGVTCLLTWGSKLRGSMFIGYKYSSVKTILQS